MLGPVIAAFGKLEHAAAADVGIAIRLGDLLAMPCDVIEHQPFTQRHVTEGDVRRAEPTDDFIEQDRAGNGQIGAPRFQTWHAKPFLEIDGHQVFADAPKLLRRHASVTQRRRGASAVGGGGDCAEAEDRPGRANHPIEPGPRDLIEVFTDLIVNMTDQFAFVASFERVALDETLGEADHSQLEASTKIYRRASSVRDFHAAATNVDHHRGIARQTDAVDGCEMDEARFLGSGDHARPDSGLVRDRFEEVASIFGFTSCTGGDCNRFVNGMRLGQTSELGQHLERSVHRLWCECPPVETAGAQPDHFFFAIDDLERQIGRYLRHYHVDRVRADVDGGYPHRATIMALFQSTS
jgi:hypothetical protein